MSERVRIFSNGTEYQCWDERNCDRCALKPHESDDAVCDIFEAIMESMCADGTFSREIADRMGFRDACRSILGWRCAEFRTEVPGPKTAAEEMAAAGASLLPGFDDLAIRRGGNQ